MITKFSPILIFILYLCIASCRPEIEYQQIHPESEAEIKVKNGRIVFRDNATFLKIRNELTSADLQEVIKWEKNYDFRSLREALSTQDSLAIELVESFGFPNGLTAYINANGEFQIGDKISWYNDGFRHDFDTEQQLAAAKKDQSLSKSKFPAGIQDLVGLQNLESQYKVETVYSVNGDTPSNDKYVQYLDLVGVPEQRRYLYQTYVYTEKMVSEYPSSDKFYTALVLKIRLDYRSRRDWPYSGYTWKPSADPRHIEIDVRTTGSCSIEYGGQVPDRQGLPSQRKYFTNSPHTVNIDMNTESYNILQSADLYIENYGGSFSYSKTAVKWDYGIFGRISQSKPGFTQTNGQPADYTVENQFGLW